MSSTDTDSEICKRLPPLKRSPPSTQLSNTLQAFIVLLYNVKFQLTKTKDAVPTANYAINFIKKGISSGWIVEMQAILENIETKRGRVASSSGSDSSETSGKQRSAQFQMKNVTTLEEISNNGKQFAVAFFEFYLRAIDITRSYEQRYKYCKDALQTWNHLSRVLEELKQAIKEIEATETVEPIDE
ncbi:uncharacterized protein LOC116344991 [Contarinia nasturtii]|uniref:uncharacterized protein LOC116344991 n=1 Tax=Contarinia nasturtii TaxID=265458 RepID=UPI0012D4AFED|nr:uncharacterized protein LOC116344991 [Contarinia nasturtii]